MGKKIAIVAVIIVVLSGIAFGVWALFKNRNGGTAAGITLTYWGLFEPPELIIPLIETYQEEHPNVTIQYEVRSYPSLSQHKETLLARLQEGAGPDIARVHASWIPQFFTELYPAPSTIINFTDFASTFYPSAVEALTVDQAIYAIPLQYDGLVVFYNKQLLAETGLDTPPITWGEFRQTATQLTKREGNLITQAGAALGTSTNIDHAADIFGLMLVQSGVSIPQDLTSQAAQDATIFYTNFTIKDRVWDVSMPEATVAFANGQLAMMLAPSWRTFEIREINPGLDFGFSPVPQLPATPEGQETVSWASFWAEAVSRDTAYPEVAWDFLNYLASAPTLQEFYSSAAALRAFGEIYPRQELASNLSVDPYASVVLADALHSVTGIFCGRAGNKFEVDAVNTALEAVLRGGSTLTALETLKTALETPK